MIHTDPDKRKPDEPATPAWLVNYCELQGFRPVWMGKISALVDNSTDKPGWCVIDNSINVVCIVPATTTCEEFALMISRGRKSP